MEVHAHHLDDLLCDYQVWLSKNNLSHYSIFSHPHVTLNVGEVHLSICTFGNSDCLDIHVCTHLNDKPCVCPVYFSNGTTSHIHHTHMHPCCEGAYVLLMLLHSGDTNHNQDVNRKTFHDVLQHEHSTDLDLGSMLNTMYKKLS